MRLLLLFATAIFGTCSIAQTSNQFSWSHLETLRSIQTNLAEIGKLSNRYLHNCRGFDDCYFHDPTVKSSEDFLDKTEQKFENLLPNLQVWKLSRTQAKEDLVAQYKEWLGVNLKDTRPGMIELLVRLFRQNFDRSDKLFWRDSFTKGAVLKLDGHGKCGLLPSLAASSADMTELANQVRDNFAKARSALTEFRRMTANLDPSSTEYEIIRKGTGENGFLELANSQFGLDSYLLCANYFERFYSWLAWEASKVLVRDLPVENQCSNYGQFALSIFKVSVRGDAAALNFLLGSGPDDHLKVQCDVPLIFEPAEPYSYMPSTRTLTIRKPVLENSDLPYELPYTKSGVMWLVLRDLFHGDIRLHGDFQSK